MARIALPVPHLPQVKNRSLPTTSIRMVGLVRPLLLLTLCAGFGLRLVLLDRFPLREDEAIYSFWALHLWQVDPWALTVWPDKPPVFLWLLGGLLQLLGPSDAAARLLNVAADTLTITVVGGIAHRLWGQRQPGIGLAAALFYGLNPFAISFATTVYTDPLLVLWGMLACLAALRQRSFLAGLFLALAIMTKQQGLFYVPLVVVLWMAAGGRWQLAGSRRQAAGGRWQAAGGGWQAAGGRRQAAGGRRQVAGGRQQAAGGRWQVAGGRQQAAGGRRQVADGKQPCPERSRGDPADNSQLAIRNSQPCPERSRGGAPPLTHFLLGLSTILLPILWWDSRRWQVAPSPWDLGARNYGTLTVVPPGQWWPRLVEWMPNLWYLTASWPLWVLIILACVGTGVRWPFAVKVLGLSRVFILFALGFLAIHVVGSIQIWDRYLLPLAPLIALLGGSLCIRLIAGMRRFTEPTNRPFLGRSLSVLLGGIFLLLLLPPGLKASQGRFPVGGDHGDYAGLRRALVWVTANAPQDAVLYHRSLGWQFQFYLFSSSSDDPRLELRWFPTPVYLADNAAKTSARRKFLIQPDWAPVRDAQARLAVRQITWQERVRIGKFTVYELVLPPGTYCDWCVCTLPTEAIPHPENARRSDPWIPFVYPSPIQPLAGS